MLFKKYYIYMKNLLFHFNKKVHIKKLQIWVGQKCTLKCVDCSQLFPYIEQYLYDMDKTVSELEFLLTLVDPDELHIIGGEPFTHPEIDKLINFISLKNPLKNNKIITNGSIIPGRKVIDALKQNKNNIFISLSPYQCIKEKQLKFMEKLQSEEIPVALNASYDDPWFYVGRPAQVELMENEIEYCFKICWDKSCHTLANGMISLCPRMHNSPKVYKDEKRNFFEHVPISKIPANFIGRALIATCFSNECYREACRRCYGVGSKVKIYCERAAQLSDAPYVNPE